MCRSYRCTSCMKITQTFAEVDDQLNAFQAHKPFCIQADILGILDDDSAATCNTITSQIVLQMLAPGPFATKPLPQTRQHLSFYNVLFLIICHIVFSTGLPLSALLYLSPMTHFSNPSSIGTTLLSYLSLMWTKKFWVLSSEAEPIFQVSSGEPRDTRNR